MLLSEKIKNRDKYFRRMAINTVLNLENALKKAGVKRRRIEWQREQEERNKWLGAVKPAAWETDIETGHDIGIFQFMEAMAYEIKNKRKQKKKKDEKKP